MFTALLGPPALKLEGQEPSATHEPFKALRSKPCVVIICPCQVNNRGAIICARLEPSHQLASRACQFGTTCNGTG